MLFVYVAGRAFVCHIWRISTISQKLKRQRDNTAETLRGCYFSVNVINLPTHLYCITYWLADNLGTLFLRSDLASSSTATPSTSSSTTPALKWFKFLPEKLQQSGSADDRSQSSSSSTCATMHAQLAIHELWASLPEEMPSPSGWDGRQPIHSLPHLHKT